MEGGERKIESNETAGKEGGLGGNKKAPGCMEVGEVKHSTAQTQLVYKFSNFSDLECNKNVQGNNHAGIVKKRNLKFSKPNPSPKQKKMHEFFQCSDQPTEISNRKSEVKSKIVTKKRKADHHPGLSDHHRSSKRVKRTIMDYYSNEKPTL